MDEEEGLFALAGRKYQVCEYSSIGLVVQHSGSPTAASVLDRVRAFWVIDKEARSLFLTLFRELRSAIDEVIRSGSPQIEVSKPEPASGMRQSGHFKLADSLQQSRAIENQPYPLAPFIEHCFSTTYGQGSTRQLPLESNNARTNAPNW